LVPDPGIFYPETGSRRDEENIKQTARPGKRVCAKCPVRKECLLKGLADEEGYNDPATGLWRRLLPFGIWGGHTALERHAPHVRHLEDCDYWQHYASAHYACRPIEDRVTYLEEQFKSTVYIQGLLTRTEEVA
jgi:hypothetical protein